MQDFLETNDSDLLSLFCFCYIMSRNLRLYSISTHRLRNLEGALTGGTLRFYTVQFTKLPFSKEKVKNRNVLLHTGKGYTDFS